MEDETEEGIEEVMSGVVREKRWVDKNGRVHRDDGPALIYYIGKELCEYWYKDGKPYEPSAHEIMVWKMKKKEG